MPKLTPLSQRQFKKEIWRTTRTKHRWTILKSYLKSYWDIIWIFQWSQQRLQAAVRVRYFDAPACCWPLRWRGHVSDDIVDFLIDTCIIHCCKYWPYSQRILEELFKRDEANHLQQQIRAHKGALVLDVVNLIDVRKTKEKLRRVLLENLIQITLNFVVPHSVGQTNVIWTQA